MTVRPRDIAIVAAVISLFVTWWVWGSISPIPVVSDEQSYVLQSRIFASGQWAASSPAIPEFFEQSHVLTVPAVASKFPPGHALLLSIGSLVGVPALIPLLLTALTGALIVLLALRVSNVWVAALTLIVWLSDPVNLRFRPSYYSEVTTQALWLLSLLALFEWRRNRDRRWLYGLAACMGWGAITRPLTMLALAIPVGVVVIRDVTLTKAWRDFAIATAIGVAILGVIPLWSAQTTGDWRMTPLSLYRRDYLPYDKPGFGVDRTPPARPLNPVNRFTYSEFEREHAVHVPSNLPRIALDRLRVIAISEWSGARMAVAPFVVVGLFAMTAEVGFALICSLALFVAYLSYGHFAEWTLYYFEGLPVLSLLAALGAWRVFELVASRIGSRAPPQLPHRLALGATVALLGVVAHEAGISRAAHQSAAQWQREFDQAVSAFGDHPAVIFVHYAERNTPHPNVVVNSPHLETEAVWVVNDRGDRNRELMRIAGVRVPIAFHEEGRRFEVDRSLLRPP